MTVQKCTDNINGTDDFGDSTGNLSNSEGYGMISFGVHNNTNLSAGFNIKTYTTRKHIVHISHIVHFPRF